MVLQATVNSPVRVDQIAQRFGGRPCVDLMINAHVGRFSDHSSISLSGNLNSDPFEPVSNFVLNCLAVFIAVFQNGPAIASTERDGIYRPECSQQDKQFKNFVHTIKGVYSTFSITLIAAAGDFYLQFEPKAHFDLKTWRNRGSAPNGRSHASKYQFRSS